MWTSAATGALTARARPAATSPPKRTGSLGRQAGLALARAISACAAASSSPRVLSAIAAHLRRAHPARGAPRRSAISSGSGGIGDARVVVDVGRARPVAEHEHVGLAAVQQARASRRSTRGARARPGPRRTAAARAPRPRRTSRAAAPATKSEMTWSTAIPQPEIAIPVCPVATNADSMPARARGRVELQRHRHLADRAVGADRVHDAHVGPVRPAGTLSPGGAARRSRSSTPARRGRRGQLGVLGEHGVQPGLDVHARRDRLQQRGAPLVGQRAAERRDADHEHVRAERRGLGHGRPRSAPAAARTARPRSARRPADAASTTRRPRARRSAGCRARSWRASRRTAPPVNSASRSAIGRLHAEAGAVGQHEPPVARGRAP